MITNLMSEATLSTFGALTVIVNIAVELIKDFFPKVPTKIITIIISILICIIYGLVENGISVLAFISGIFSGLIVAYSAMSGFDTIKEIHKRIKVGEDK